MENVAEIENESVMGGLPSGGNFDLHNECLEMRDSEDDMKATFYSISTVLVLTMEIFLSLTW